MRILTFFSFTSLFMTASAGLLLAYIVYSTSSPWIIDDAHNRWLLLAPQNVSLTDHIVNLARENPDTLLKWIRSQYMFSALCLFMASSIMILITFLAVRNRGLVLAVHVTVCIWLALVTLHMAPMLSEVPTIHLRLFSMSLVMNIIGSLCYAVHIFKTKKRVGGQRKSQQQQQQQQQPTPKSATHRSTADSSNTTTATTSNGIVENAALTATAAAAAADANNNKKNN